MDLGGLNPQDAQQYLEGINWPADKQEVVNKAEENGAPQGMMEQLKSLGDGQFSGVEDVTSRRQGG